MNPEPSSALLLDPTALHIEVVGLDQLHVIRRMNHTIFGEERIINRFDRPDLLMLVAYHHNEPVGFKVGYAESGDVFYSAKGGVMPAYRRQGIARHLLDEMIRRVKQKGYRRFAFDTFPNRHYGMAVLGFKEDFRLTAADFNPVYRDYRLRFEKSI